MWGWGGGLTGVVHIYGKVQEKYPQLTVWLGSLEASPFGENIDNYLKWDSLPELMQLLTICR